MLSPAGKREEALTAYTSALEIMERINHPNQGVPMVNIAVLSIESEELEQAETLIRKARERFVHQNWLPNLAVTHLLYLTILASKQSWKRWDNYFDAAAGILNETHLLTPKSPCLPS